jgi:hypothetical protein
MGGRRPVRKDVTQMAAAVPVAGQNAGFDASAVEWEAHMRTAVEGKDSTPVFDNQYGAMRTADDEPPFAREFLDCPCA